MAKPKKQMAKQKKEEVISRPPFLFRAIVTETHEVPGSKTIMRGQIVEVNETVGCFYRGILLGIKEEPNVIVDNFKAMPVKDFLNKIHDEQSSTK